MLVDRANLQGLYTGFSTIFNTAFEGYTPSWPKVAMEVPSTSKENAYPWLGRLKGMREWVGDRVITNLAQYGFKIVNKDFENTVAVDRNDIEDDQVGVYNPVFADLGQTAAEHPDELVWPLLKNGFTSLCYDGQYFFDTDHPVINPDGTEGTASNFGGGAGTAWFLVDTSRAIKPLIFQRRKAPQLVRKDAIDDDNVFMKKQFLYGVDGRWNAGYGLWQLAYASKQTLDEANFTAAFAAFTSLKSDYGRPLWPRPTFLVVQPSQRDAAWKIVKAERLANGADNPQRGLVDLIVEPRLA
jgi:phage major head subunit gpT-like protein